MLFLVLLVPLVDEGRPNLVGANFDEDETDFHEFFLSSRSFFFFAVATALLASVVTALRFSAWELLIVSKLDELLKSAKLIS